MSASELCHTFRAEALAAGASFAEFEDRADGHAASCAACRLWLRRQRASIGVLGALRRWPAPHELDERLSLALTSATVGAEAPGVVEALETADCAALERVWELAELAAPQALDARVAAELAAQATESAARPPLVRALGRLSRPRAPEVLERLVREELERPASRRFVDELERRRAPVPLTRRVDGELRGTHSRSLAWALGGIAAATLFVFFGRSLLPGAVHAERARSFQVVLGTDATELHPILEGMREVLQPVELAPLPKEALEAAAAQARRQEVRLPERTRRMLGNPADVPGEGTTPTGASASATADETTTHSSGSGATSAHDGPLAAEWVFFDNATNPAPYSMIRRVEVYDYSAPEATRFTAYRELVASDGAGQFVLEPFQALSAVTPDIATFLNKLRLRAGFLYRYRDFAVRDRAALRATQTVTELAPTTVAGRACRVFRYERTDGRAWEVAVETAHDLVLRSAEFDVEGQLAALVECELIDDSPDHSSIVFHVSSNAEAPVALADVEGLTEYAVQIGGELPEGYRLSAASTVLEASGRAWLKLLYTDGIDPLFFLVAPRPGAGGPGGSAPPSTTTRPGMIHAYRFAGRTALQGEFDGQELIVLGKPDLAELVALVESSLL